MPLGKALQHIDRLRKRVEFTMLPQSVQLIIQNARLDAAGMRTKPATRRVIYKGTSNIPARLDSSQHYRQADIHGQEVNVSEFDVHLPRAVEPPLDCQILLEGTAYEVRKLQDDQAWDVTTTVLAVRVNKPSLAPPLDALTDGDTGYLITETGDRMLL